MIKLLAKSSLILLVLHAGTRISLLAHHDLSVADYYLPTALALVFVHRFGPRLVLPIMYINAVSTSVLWGNPAEQWWLWFIFGVPETVYIFLSWFLFKKVFRGDSSLNDINNLLQFLLVGISLPIVIEILLLQTMLLTAGVQSAANFLKYVTSNMLSEFATAFFITIPALHYSAVKLHPFINGVRKDHAPEIAILILALTSLVFFLDFKSYWFVYGFFPLYASIRFGFGPAIATNSLIICLTYILPKLFSGFGKNNITSLDDTISVLLGANLLYTFAAITGRVIDDLKRSESQMLEKNVELEEANRQLNQTNKELDRFVYSVSHDLSAPLKSIMGLVNISKLARSEEEKDQYFKHIGSSVHKLEAFISEILDYSTSKRSQVVVSQISLQRLCNDILESLQHFATKKAHVELDLKVDIIHQDKARVRIALNNLVANAFRYQRQNEDHNAWIRISSVKRGGKIIISVEDNGEGIPPEIQNRVFEMFYRGSERAKGSGLGLFIAQEAIETINGQITFTSVLGQGSAFHIEFEEALENQAEEPK